MMRKIVVAVLTLLMTFLGVGAASAADTTTTPAPPTNSIDGWFKSSFVPFTSDNGTTITTDPITWQSVNYDKQTRKMEVIAYANFPADAWGTYHPLALRIYPNTGGVSACSDNPFAIIRTVVVPTSNTAFSAKYTFDFDFSCLGPDPDYSRVVFEFTYLAWLDAFGEPPAPGNYSGAAGTGNVQTSTAFFALIDYTDAHDSGSVFYDAENPDKYKITDAGLTNSDGTVVPPPKDDAATASDYCIVGADGFRICGTLDESNDNTIENLCVIKNGQQVCGAVSCTVNSGATLGSKFCGQLQNKCVVSFVGEWDFTACMLYLIIPNIPAMQKRFDELGHAASTRFPFGMLAAAGSFFTAVGDGADYRDHGTDLEYNSRGFCYPQAQNWQYPCADSDTPTAQIKFLEPGSPGDKLLVAARPILTGALVAMMWLLLGISVYKAAIKESVRITP